MFKSNDLQKKCCLTCQYFKIRRKVEVIGSQVFIDYDSSTGNCGIFNNFPYVVTQPANMSSTCRYKRWVQLPD